MSIPIPNARPKADLLTVIETAKKQFFKDNPGKCFPAFFVLAVRGYYSRTIAPDGNNLNAYDDAFFIVTPGHFSAWNGNTDPTRDGWNPNAGKYMARLKAGSYKFKRWFHRGRYWAFGQADNPVTVERIDSNGKIRKTETGNNFGINLHKGGVNSTSSEGCLTVPVEQWNRFDSTLAGLMKSLESPEFDLILVDGPIN